MLIAINSPSALATRRKPILGGSTKKSLFPIVANASVLFACEVRRIPLHSLLSQHLFVIPAKAGNRK
ncbi:hypothetical protein [Shewanella putrefaciens]|uniref:hypothetical protein n=1 Tax=Shewanella putrefaciens TaxID=24 RepID=UPI0002F8734C